MDIDSSPRWCADEQYLCAEPSILELRVKGSVAFLADHDDMGDPIT